MSSRGGSEVASGTATASSWASAASVCGATRIDCSGIVIGVMAAVSARARSSSASSGSPNSLRGSRRLSTGPAMKVVTSAISTSAANSASEMTPFSSARLSTISSVRPRVFMSVPITADSRQPRPVTREASSVPPNLQAMATTSSTTVSTTSSKRSSSSTLVFRPV